MKNLKDNFKVFEYIKRLDDITLSQFKNYSKIYSSIIELDNRDDDFTIISSYDYKVFEDEVVKYGRKNNIDVKFKYMGDLDIVDELNAHSSDYDAVWISNSMWLYMLDNQYLVTNAKSIAIDPVVIGVNKTKAKEVKDENKIELFAWK